jgi:hypothetical protein
MIKDTIMRRTKQSGKIPRGCRENVLPEGLKPALFINLSGDNQPTRQGKALRAVSFSDSPIDCLYEYHEENASEQSENERQCLLLPL